jgi:putative glutamine amidotransferase
MTAKSKCLIGLSPRILRDIPREMGFQGKTLQYLEQSVAHLAMSFGHMVVMVPTIEHEGLMRRSSVHLADYVAALDGLILQGGADIHPSTYGEVPRHTKGPVDPIRDRFELDLLRAFVAAQKPVFGICRGMQLINVAFGGTLYQDLIADGATSIAHAADIYDGHSHPLTLAPASWLSGLFGGRAESRVNSIHHQGIRKLGQGLVAVAWSDDGVVESIHGTGGSFLAGVQWHPEFHPDDGVLLQADPLIKSFLDASETGLAARRALALGGGAVI